MREINVKKLLLLFVLALAIANIAFPALNVFADVSSVQIEKLVNKSTVLIGEEFVYTIKYARPSTTGPGHSVKIIDALPENVMYVSHTPSVHVVNTIVDTDAGGHTTVTFDMGDLAAGSTGILKINAKFRPGSTLPVIGGLPNKAINTAVVTELGYLEPKLSNPVEVTPTVLDHHDFSIVKSKVIPQGDAVIGQAVTYRIVVTGNSAIGGLDLHNVIIRDVLPENAQYVSSDGGAYTTVDDGDGDPDDVNGIVAWTAVTVPAGQSVTKTIKVIYPAAKFDDTMTVHNKATVTATPFSEIDPDTGEYTAAPITLEHTYSHGFGAPAPGVGNFTKAGRQDDDRYAEGQTAQFYLRNIQNTGNIPLDSIEIIDPIPDDIALTQITTGRYNQSCTVNIAYQTNDDPGVWQPWGGGTGDYDPSPNPVLNASGLGLRNFGAVGGEYITQVKWLITNAVDGIVPGFSETSAIELRGTVSMPGAGTTISNTATLTATIDEVDPTPDTVIIKDSTKIISVISPDAWLTAQKTTQNGSSFNMGDTVHYNLTIKNHDFATGVYRNPVIYDVLPDDLDVELNAGAVVFTWDKGNTLFTELDAPSCSYMANFEVAPGVTRNVIRWEFANNLQPGEYVTLSYNADIKDGTRTGFVTNDLYVSSDTDNTFENAPELVLMDALGAGKLFYKASKQVFVRFIGGMDSQKWVKGELDKDVDGNPVWCHYTLASGDHGQTLPTGIADYRFEIENTGSNGPISNIVLIDILPHMNDVGVLDPQARETAWEPYLVNKITGQDGGAVPAGIEVYYSTKDNPSLVELSDPLHTPNPADLWSTTPPADITTVKSIKIYFHGRTLDTGEKVVLEWPMRAPAHAPVGIIAWNSFGYGATYPDVDAEGNPIQVPFLPSEPEKVGFKVYAQPAGTYLLGDFVWEDLNKNGIQDADEPGINGVLVNLYNREPGVGVEPIKYTRTGDDYQAVGSGKPGYYGFTNLPAGTYYLEFVYPQDYKVTPHNAPGSTVDNDSNLDGAAKYDKTDNGVDKYALKTGLINLIANDTSIDLGLYLPASVGDYVWKDNNADGVQDVDEHGIPNISVELIDAGTGARAKGWNGADVPLAVTDANGAYLFSNLEPGNYKIKFANSGGIYKFSPKNTTTEDKDSDTETIEAGELSATTQGFSLKSQEINRTLDIGMYLGEIGDFVWEDKDADGVQDTGETGIPGVTVKLTDGTGAPVENAYGAVIGDTATDVNGKYLFADLKAGTYIVEVVKKAGFDKYSPLDNYTDDIKDSDVSVTTGKTAEIVLARGERNHNIDAGLYRYASIGNFVWEDLDADGRQDTEPALAGVKVKLFNEAGDQVILNDEGGVIGDGAPDYKITVGADGLYLFDKLKPGKYRVQFEKDLVPTYVFTQNDQGGDTADSDAVSTGAHTARSGLYTLDSGEYDQTVDAGLHKGIIGDFVWEDMNGNGKRETGDNGIAGVTVKLLSGLGAELATTVTNAGGYYEFNRLDGGEYKVQFVLPADYYFTLKDAAAPADEDSDPDRTTGITDTISLDNGEVDKTWDAGMFRLAEVGDYVWEDLDMDGIQDAGEAAVPGVKVRITHTDGSAVTDGLGVPVGEATTGADGKYLFDDLEPGNYIIEFEVASDDDYIFTPALQGADRAVDSDPTPTANPKIAKTAAIALTSGEVDLSVDAGVHKGVLGDFVWEDMNGNGKQDAGENGIPGVTVKLLNGSGAELTSTVTNASGYYEFNRLDSGDYKLQFVLPPDYHFTLRDVPADDTKDSDPDRTTGITNLISLDNGEVDKTWDAGMFQLAEVGDYVWEDLDLDGIQDGGESAVSGVKVRITHTDGSAVTDGLGVAVGEATTGADGKYLFDDLEPGNYIIEFEIVPTAHYIFSPSLQGADRAVDSDPVPTANPKIAKTAAIALDSREVDLSVDAGLHKAVLGDFVWEDMNGNGKQDAGENGIPNVTVKLLDGLGAELAQTQTDAGGHYEFNRLDGGNYKVQFVLPANYHFTYQNAVVPADDAADSDPDRTTGVAVDIATGVISLADGQVDRNWDAGLYRDAKVGDYVWLDTDGDGLQDVGELPIQGVTVTLEDSETGSVLSTQATAADGKYLFDSLAPGDYTVKFDAQAMYKLTVQNADGNTQDAIDNDIGPMKMTNVNLTSGSADLTIDAGYRYDTGIDIQKTVYFGHDGGAQAGVDLLEGQVGRPITYKFVVTNTGKTYLSNFAINDVPLGITTAAMTKLSGNAVLAPTQTQVYYYETTIITDLTNTAVVTADPSNDTGVALPQAAQVSDSDDSQVNAINPLIDLQKSVYYGHDGGASYNDPAKLKELALGQHGTEITYVFKVTNTGNTNLNNILINDPDLAINTADLTPIGAPGILAPAGAGVQYYYYETTIEGDLLNTADVIAVPCDAGGVALPEVSSPTDTDTAQVEEIIPGIEVSKTVYRGHDGGAQVGSDKLAAPAGTAITYVFTVRNTGTKHLNNIVIDDLTLNGGAGIHKADMTLKSEVEPLAPGATLVYYYETTLSGDLHNRVDVEGTPCDNLGNPLTHVDKPNHLDTADVWIGASVGDYVWRDSNQDGVQDASESGIAGVKVILKDNLGNKLAEKTTDGSGKYLFTDLIPGQYIISVDQATVSGMVESYELDLTVNNSVSFTLNSGDAKRDVDFGYYTPIIFYPPPPTAAVGDLVWEDTNKNGVFDSGETGIAGVKVILKNSGGSVVSTTLTNNKGEYQFNSLVPGEYEVSVEKATLPGNYIQTYELDAVMDNSVKANLSGGSFKTDVDFGYYKIIPPPPVVKNDASVGDYVWYDADGDGIQDASEKGIAKVRVILTDVNGKETKVITDSQGKYLFSDLPPGVYIIRVDQATLPKSMKSTYELDKSLNNNVTFMLAESAHKVDIDFGYDFTGVAIEEDKIPEGSAMILNLDKVLPKTGIPYYNLLLLGLLFAALSSVALVVLRKKKHN